MAGIVGLAVKFEALEDTATWHKLINGVADKAKVLLGDERGRIGIGTWVHGEGEQIHIHVDVVAWVPDEERAKRVCVESGQLAYWNVKTGEAYALALDVEDDTRFLDTGDDE